MTDVVANKKQDDASELLLILAPSGRDATLTLEILKEGGIRAIVCTSATELATRMGTSAGAALIDERVLDDDALLLLADVLRKQGAWSDFPIVLFSSSSDPVARGLQGGSAASRLGNVTFLDRPVQIRSMIAAVHAAIRARRRQYQVRKAIALREQFLAMLGHELRNPLASIRLAIEALMAEPHSIESERIRQRNIIDRQSIHLARLVDDLLDVARVTHGKVTLQRERVDLSELVRACFASHRPAADANRLHYVLSGADTPRWVDGDHLRLEQIANNLLTNAIKYTPPGGSVKVSLQRTHKQGEQEKNCVVLCVADSGVGIAQDALTRIFDLFAQADRSLDRSQGGLGLGLTVVQGLVDLHGGKVEARSQGLGHGSELIVTLPLLEDAAKAEATAVDAGAGATREKTSSSSVPPPIKRRTVVIVDDNEDLRDMLETLLVSAGHDVTTAVDGPTGVDQILERQPDAAFVDLGLPGFDGYELARRVRAGQNDTSARTFLVAVSGYAQPEDRRRALDAGFDDHLKKPVGYQQLEGVLQERVREPPVHS